VTQALLNNLWTPASPNQSSGMSVAVGVHTAD